MRDWIRDLWNDVGRQIRVDRLLMLEMLDRWIRFADRSGGRKFPEDTMDEINVCVVVSQTKVRWNDDEK